MSTGDTNVDTPEGASAEAPAPAPSSRRRLILVNVLIWFTCLLTVVGLFAIWANRLLFNPDNWENTSTQLLQNQDVRSGLANYVVDQLYKNVNVSGAIKSGLPPALQGLAGPAAGALRDPLVQATEAALGRPVVQRAWAKANRAANQTFIAIVKGGKGAVSVNGGVVTLNLSAVINDVAGELGLPSNLGSKLPASAQNLTVLKSDQLKFVQNVGNAIRGLALWFTIFVPLLWILAIVLTPGRRRRTLMTVGFSMVLAGILVLLGRRILVTQIANSLTHDDDALRPAVGATVSIATELLSEAAGAVLAVGVVAVIAAWFAGPARVAVTARRAIAPFLRERAAWTFAIVAAVMLLIFIWQPIPATGTPVGMITFLVLALFGTEVLRRQTAAEFPDARMGAATAAMRARWQGWRGRRPPDAPSPST
jgi:hypothetical protein